MDKTVAPPANFSNRLKARRKALQLTQKQLAEATGISAKTIQKYEYGDIPKGSNLLRLSQALNCSIDWLLLGSGSGCESSELDKASLQKEHVELTLVPKVLARLDSDGKTLEKGQNIKSMYAFRRGWIEQKGDPFQMVLMDVSGDPMSPEIKDGDTVLVDRSQSEIFIGKIYAASIGQEVMVRYVERAPGRIILCSANNSWDDIELDIHEVSRDPVNILGRVIWWSRDVR